MTTRKQHIYLDWMDDALSQSHIAYGAFATLRVRDLNGTGYKIVIAKTKLSEKENFILYSHIFPGLQSIVSAKAIAEREYRNLLITEAQTLARKDE